MEELLSNLIKSHKALLFFYSPYNFLKEIDKKTQLSFVEKKIQKFGSQEDYFTFQVNIKGFDFVFLYEFLKWDSKFLKLNCFKLYTVLHSCAEPDLLITAINSFKKKINSQTPTYCFINIPAEDIFLIQCLTNAGLKLVETRLHFFKNHLTDWNEERAAVRKALVSDTAVIAKVASSNRNAYDRLHADFYFSEELADKYLATYAEATVKGFCDTVLVPNQPELPTESFLAISHLNADSASLNHQLHRIVLTSVALANKGWHKKLVSEAIYYAREMGATNVLMTTQATNRAVFRTCEKLKFKLGSISHILSFNC